MNVIEKASNADIAEWFRERLAGALTGTNGNVAISVPGGETPFPILKHLAAAPLDWARVEIWPGDDRLVEESHPASNAGRMRGLMEPAGARVVPLREGATPPHFAFVWLGMGADGHIASLFPNTDPRADDPVRIRRLTPDPLPPEAPYDRLSLTIPALLDSDRLVFVIRGAEKRAVLEAAAAGASDLPIARLLAAASQPATCFV